MPRLDPDRLRFTLITDRRAAARPLTEVVEAALEAGFTAVQLREKDLSARELYDLAKELREITARHGALLIVNDRLDVAAAVGADGAHLGWTSLSPQAAHKAFGDRLALGVSAHNVVEVRQAIRSRADYIQFGPIFPTPSKQGLVGPVGLPLLREMAIPSPTPVVAVGGIDAANVASVVASHAAGVAVVRAVMADADPLEAARRLIAAANGRA
jgi:thiamine-phosphate pyrophosphorylase